MGTRPNNVESRSWSYAGRGRQPRLRQALELERLVGTADTSTPAVGKRSQDCIENRIEVLAHIFGEKP